MKYPKTNVRYSLHFTDYLLQQNTNEKPFQIKELCDLSTSYFVQTPTFHVKTIGKTTKIINHKNYFYKGKNEKEKFKQTRISREKNVLIQTKKGQMKQKKYQ